MLLFKSVFVTLDLLHFHMNLRINSLVSAPKRPPGRGDPGPSELRSTDEQTQKLALRSLETPQLKKGWSQPKALSTCRAGSSRKTPAQMESPINRLEDEFESIFQK